jgi:hypothetical protein
VVEQEVQVMVKILIRGQQQRVAIPEMADPEYKYK